MKWSEVDISLNHDVMALFSLQKWPWFPRSRANFASVTVKGCTHMPLGQHNNGLNTLYMSNMNVWSSLRWILASTMMLCHQFHSTSDPDFPDPTANLAGVMVWGWNHIPLRQHNISSTHFGMVQAWVPQKLLKHYILRVFTMSDSINILGVYWLTA